MSVRHGWTPELATGIKAIDDQHKQLFHEVEQLLTAMRYGYSHAEVKRTMEFLCGYVTDHFHGEEDAMRRARYPGAPAHKESHEEFAGRLRKLRLEMAMAGPSKAMAVKVQQVLCVTLTDDIVKQDMVMAAFLRERPAGASGLFRKVGRWLRGAGHTTRIMRRTPSSKKGG